GVTVPGDRELAELAAAGPDDHQGVCPRSGATTGGCSTLGLLLVAALLLRRSRFQRVRRAAVGADHQDVLRARQQPRVALEGIAGVTVEFHRLDLSRNREREQAEQEPAEAG